MATTQLLTETFFTVITQTNNFQLLLCKYGTFLLFIIYYLYQKLHEYILQYYLNIYCIFYNILYITKLF